MLAKAVAHHTTAAFIHVVGSEFVQKYLGSNPCDHCVCFLIVLPFLSFPCFEIESSSVSIYLWSL
jgi:hypothetical protein